MKKLLAKIRKILHDRRTRRFLTRFVSGVAALIVFVTTYALVLPAITMEKEANCGIEAHQHDDFCYTEELICDIPESDGHHHDESCYSTTSALVCETEEHEHSAENGCYDDEGNLICEVMEHRHNEECYEEVRELTCQIPESEGHHHTEDCYEKVLTCGKEVHVHSTACYENDPVSESAIAASTSSAAASTTSVGSVSSAGMTLNFEGDIEKIIDADEPVDGDPVDNLGSDKTNGSSETNDTSEIASSSETNTEAASDTEVTYGRENAGTGRTETSNTALTNADNNATALTSSADTDQYIPQLDAVDFNTVLNNHTGIYYYRAADEDIVEDSSAIPAEDWNRIPNNIDRINDDMDDVELGNKDLLRVYLSYTIPAGSLNATNPVARYRLPSNLHLTDPQVKAINENVNGLAGQYVDMSTLEITDPDKYNAYLGVEAVEGTRRPDEAVEDYLAEQAWKAGKDAENATEYISAVVRVENVYDADGLYGEKDAYLGQDLIFTFAPYSIEKNQHEYDSTGKPTKAGEEIKGWFTFDLNMGQVDFEEPEITTSTVKESDTENAKGDNKDNQIGKDDPEDIKPDAGFGEDDNHQNEHSEDSHSVDNSAADHESVMDAESGKEAENASKSLVTIKRSERSAEIVFIEDGWDEKGNKINQISTTLTAVEKIMVEAQDDDTEENNTETAREDESTAITDNTTEKINNDETEKTASDDKEDTVDVSSGKKTLVDSEESDQIIMPAMSFTDSIKVSTGKPSGIDENAGGILADAAESLPEKAKVLVRVEADEGTFPAGTKMVLKAVTKEDMEALAETVANTVEKDSSDSVENSVPNTNTGDNKKNNVNRQNNNSNSSSNIKAFGFQAVDITFFDKDGNEIEPAKPVRVALTSKTVEQFRKEAENSPIADPVVVHVDNDGNAEQMELVVPEDVEPAKGKTEEELNETIAAEETSTAGDDADTADDSDVDTVKQSEKNENKEPQESSEDSSTETSVGDNISSAEDEMGAVEKGTDTEEQLNPDNDETESKGVTAGTGSTVEFEAESFSVYAIVYTVDFHWEVDGKVYEFSLDGGTGISLRDLFTALGICTDDLETEEDEVRTFLDNIGDVQFSNSELAWVGRVNHDNTIRDIKEFYEFECKYSGGLSEEEKERLDSRMVYAGEWGFVSLRPFTSEESLSVTMADGEEFVVKVTDEAYDGAVLSVTNLDGKTGVLVRTRSNVVNAVQGTALNSTHLQAAAVTINSNRLTTGNGVQLTQWSFTKVEGTEDRYLIQADNGKYLNIGVESATVSDQAQELVIETSGNEIQIKRVEDDYALNNDKNQTAEGYFSYNSGNYVNPGEWFTVYEVEEPAIVTLHFVGKDGTPLTGFSFNGTEIEGSTYKVTASWVQENLENKTYERSRYVFYGYNDSHNQYEYYDESGNVIDLNRFEKTGYTLSNTHRGAFDDITGNSSNTHTITDNMFKWNETNQSLQYWAYYTGNDKAGGDWYNIGTHPNNWSRDVTSHSSNDDTTAIRDYYLVYDGTPANGSGSQGGGEELNPQNLDKIKTDKDVEPNGDGTYDVTLGITGSAEHTLENPHANVIIVFDTSSSMVSNREPLAAGMTEADRKTRLQRGKAAINNFADVLLGMNDPQTDSEKVQLALISFDRTAYTQQFTVDGARTYWTNNYNAFSSVVGAYTGNTGINDDGNITDTSHNTGLNTHRGTNWAQAFSDVNSLTLPDNDPTYVLFFTDGAPSQYWELTNGSPMFYADGECCYFGARDEARETIRKGYEVFSVFAYGDANDSHNDYLGKLMKYAYNGDASFDVDAHRINATNTAAVESALAEILGKIQKDLGYEKVSVHDGITELSHTTLVSGRAENFTYKICKYNVTTDDQGNTIKTVVEGSEATITENNDGTLSVLFPGKTQAVTINKASYVESEVEGSTQKEVTWQFGNEYMLEDGYTYEVSFTIWPSQDAYDLIADLENELVKITDLEDKVNAQLIVDVNGTVYTFDSKTGKWTGETTSAALQALIDNASNVIYSLKTNTHADVDYTIVYRKDGEVVSTQTVTGEEIKDPHGKMILSTNTMTVRKGFSHAINSASPFKSLVFYLRVDDGYYKKDGTVTAVEPTSETADQYYSITLPKNSLPANPTEAQIEAYWADSNWSDTVYIAPGLMKGGSVLETGHRYSLHEVVIDGDEFEYEFTPQIVRPMNINDTSPTFLIREDDYNAPSGTATTYSFNDAEKTYSSPASGDNKYYVENGNKAELVGTNRKTSELDITKQIVDETHTMSKAELDAQTFTYRVTLEVPYDSDDPTGKSLDGITAYEYVPRVNDAYNGTGRIYVYGYQSQDITLPDGSTITADTANARGFSDDVEKVEGQIYGRYTVTRVGGGNTLKHVFERVGDKWVASIDITLKHNEVIRFTNLPTGTEYTINEVYANLRQADPSRNIDATPSTDVSSNLTEQGYTKTTYKTRSEGVESDETNGTTITGEILKQDVRYYNQFTNKRTSIPDDLFAELKVKKVVDGYDWGTEYYNMTLTAGTATYSDEETPATGTSPMHVTDTNSVSIYNYTEDHTLSFGEVVFTRPGTYTYTVSEYNNSANMPYVMFASPVTLTIEIDKDADGKLYVKGVSDNSGIEGNTFLTDATDTSLGAITTTMTNRSKPVNLKKVDKVSGSVAEGAVFELHKNGELMYIDSNNRVLTRKQVLARISTEENPITDIRSEAAVAAMQDAGITSSFTIGEISLNGFAMTGYTYSGGTFTEQTPAVYELVETSPPPGYIITENNNYFKVRGIRNQAETNRVRYTGIEICLTDQNGNDLLDENSQPKQTNNNATVNSDTMTISLTNETGAELPHTGGYGNSRIYLISIILMAFAGAGLLAKGRRRKRV